MSIAGTSDHFARGLKTFDATLYPQRNGRYCAARMLFCKRLIRQLAQVATLLDKAPPAVGRGHGQRLA